MAQQRSNADLLLLGRLILLPPMAMFSNHSGPP
jgi:hypothetical protein